MEEEGVGASDDVGLCAEVGEDVELLKGGVGAEEAPLEVLAGASLGSEVGSGRTYLAKDLQREAHVLEERVPVARPQTRRGLQVALVLIKFGVGAVLQVPYEIGYQRDERELNHA